MRPRSELLGRPTSRLVGALAVCTLLALASAGLPWLLGPTLGCLAIVLGLFTLDLRRTPADSGFELGFELPARCQLRAPFQVSYALRNRSAHALTLWLLDERSEPLGGDLELGPLRLAPGAEQRLVQTWCAEQRGQLRLGPVHVRVRSTLGLFERRLYARAAGAVLHVLPNPGTSERALPGAALEPGLRPRRPRGAGMELDSLRPYTEGDDPRHVDWRASARSPQLVVRTFRAERHQSLVLAVDTGRLMAARVDGLCKLDHALNTSVALAQAALLHRDRVAFAAFDAEPRSWLAPTEPRRGLGLLLEAVSNLAPRSVESSFRVLTELLESRNKKRSLIVLITDFIEASDALELEGYLARLAKRHVVLLVALRDPLLSLEDQPLVQASLDEPTLYRRMVLQDLTAERDLILRRLSRQGVHTLDVRPERARAPVLQRYLELRRAL